MGLTSIVLRAPFAALGDALGGQLSTYRLGAFACLWTLAGLALALALALRRESELGAWITVPLLMLNPITTTAVTSGHPEELVLAASAAAGVWLAARGLAQSGGALTGVAIGVKPFGGFAFIPALLATRRQAGQVAIVALVVGALLTLPLPAFAPHVYIDGGKTIARHKRIYAASIWWPVGNDRRLVFSTGQGPETQTLREMPGGLDRGTSTLAGALFALTAGLLVALRRRDDLGFDALALLAAVFFARAFFDSENLEYYAAPALAALAAWEVLGRRRPPLLTAVVVALDLLTFHAGLGRAGLQATIFLLWVLPLTGYLLAVAAARRFAPVARSGR
jgi:Glycosyltransferase family 87